LTTRRGGVAAGTRRCAAGARRLGDVFTARVGTRGSTIVIFAASKTEKSA
jgi:hypothetical protein